MQNILSVLALNLSNEFHILLKSNAMKYVVAYAQYNMCIWRVYYDTRFAENLDPIEKMVITNVVIERLSC